MKLEKLNYGKEKYHKIFLYGLISAVVLLLVFTLIPSKAKYRVTQSVPLVKGKIKNEAYDFNIVSMYIKDYNGEEIGKDGTKYKQLGTEERMPDEGYTINETNSYCYIDSKENPDTNAKLYTNEDGEHIIFNLSKKEKCYLYFDKKATAGSSIVGPSTVKPTIGGMFNVSDGTTTTGVLYEAEDDYGTSYYYRGAPTDNWVKFGTDITNNQPMWWRIIRINGDGSIRMIYAGTGESTPSTTGTGTQIGISAFNSTYNNNMYVGYFYTQNEVHGLGTASTIYGVINNWYSTKTNLPSLQAQYIDTKVGFCNDRQVSTSKSSTTTNSYGAYVGNENGGTATTETYYGAYMRLTSNGDSPTSSTRTITPTFRCTDKDNDMFTYTGANQGNKKLANPIGLITADEVSYAGMVYGTQAITNNYLYTNQNYWTMSPSWFSSSGSYACVFFVHPTGLLGGINGVASTYGVRPVINLRSDIQLSGDGTTSSPYEIVA